MLKPVFVALVCLVSLPLWSAEQMFYLSAAGSREGEIISSQATDDYAYPETVESGFFASLAERALAASLPANLLPQVDELWWVVEQAEWKIRVLLVRSTTIWKTRDIQLEKLASGTKTVWKGDQGGFASIQTYDEAGILQKEEFINRKDGSVQSIFSLRHENGLLVERIEQASDQTELAREVMSYDAKGMLRSLERREADGTLKAIFYTYASGRISEVEIQEGKNSILYSYDSQGRQIQTEYFQEEELDVFVFHVFKDAESQRSERTIQLDYATGEVSDELFDAAGRVLERTLYIASGKQFDSWVALPIEERRVAIAALRVQNKELYTYDSAGLVVSHTVRSGMDSERREYERQDGELVWERLFVKDVIASEIEYAGAEMIITTYRSGLAVFKVFSRNGARYREQEISAGKVIRERNYD